MSACGVLLCAWLQAVPVPGPSIAIEARHLAMEGHVFSGRELPLTLRVYGAQGRRLDLRVRPYQLAYSLAAPAGPAIEVAQGAELGPAAWHDFSLALDCPAFEQAVEWELQFLARTGAEETWQVAGRARLVLHPPDLCGPLRADARERSWFVSDAPGALKAFLTREGIPFGDLDLPAGREAWTRSRTKAESAASAPRAPVAGREPLVLLVRTSDLQESARSSAFTEKSSCLLVFEPTAHAPALQHEPGRTRVTLDLELIARLGEDPRAQLALVEAVELTRRDTPTDG